jgi:hypothetical protein
MSATETPTTTTSAPTLDVELVPAPAPHPSAAIVDAWFLETFHGLLLSTDLFNRFNAARDALKARLAAKE